MIQGRVDRKEGGAGRRGGGNGEGETGMGRWGGGGEVGEELKDQEWEGKGEGEGGQAVRGKGETGDNGTGQTRRGQWGGEDGEGATGRRWERGKGNGEKKGKEEEAFYR